MAKSISQKAGMAFGELVYVGEGSTKPVELDLTVYNEDEFAEYKNTSLRFIQDQIKNGRKYWINVRGIHDVGVISEIARMFSFHSLLTEDLLNTEHQPKFEDHNKHLFFTLKYLHGLEPGNDLNMEHTAVVLGENSVISFQESYQTLFNKISERLSIKGRKIRTRSPDFLFFAIIDLIVDHYYFIYDLLDKEQDEIEDRGFDPPHSAILTKINENKKRLTAFRRQLAPLKDAVIKLQNVDSELVDERHEKYLNDTIDHVKDLYGRVEWLREMNVSFREAFLSAQNDKMNRVMQLLTIIATIFIPLTFIAGIYGMNFENMPELKWEYGYPLAWTIMIALAVAMILYFKRHKWF
ncbi:MAG: magnesium/cobalt transporter CorA [Bacteroidales bacterium]|nr:magnesium/cobalt transporter CorA [Bacteroidales bacterium]